jgi:hypothetical protein
LHLLDVAVGVVQCPEAMLTSAVFSLLGHDIAMLPVVPAAIFKHLCTSALLNKHLHGVPAAFQNVLCMTLIYW